jgi:glycerol-3-phosphate dehydrogenase (NAD(P)+)
LKLTVLGAGSWGTALALSVARRHDTLLWARDVVQAARMRESRRHPHYLPGIELPAELRVSADLAEALDHARGALAIVATPMSGLHEMLHALATLPDDDLPGVLWLCKGFQEGTGLLGHEVARQVCPAARCGVASGPSFAIEVARGLPTALVAASTDEALARMAQQALHGDALRVYTSNDPVGVEVGGAVKNVLAIATGIADGLGLGQNARAALVTRGLAEMTRLGVALGARAETFMGLSGLGDLVLTATGDLSRNRSVGLALAAGRPLAAILQELGHVAEGVYSAAMAVRRAQARGVEMPIAAAVADVLEGRRTPADALAALMAREARPE